MKKKKRFIQIVGNFKTPSHYVSSLRKRIHKDVEMTGMKSHDYHVMMQEILPLCLLNFMAKGYRMAFIHLSWVFKKLCSKSCEPSHNGGSYTCGINIGAIGMGIPSFILRIYDTPLGPFSGGIGTMRSSPHKVDVPC
jgi:hypothetical protein